MVKDTFQYEFSDGWSQDKKGDIVVSAGVRFCNKDGSYKDNFKGNSSPPEYEIKGKKLDSKGRRLELELDMEILSNPKDELEYTVEARFTSSNSQDPDLDEISDLWEDCLEEGEKWVKNNNS